MPAYTMVVTQKLICNHYLFTAPNLFALLQIEHWWPDDIILPDNHAKDGRLRDLAFMQLFSISSGF